MNIFKKISLLLLSSILFLNTMVTPFVVSAQETQPSTWYNQGLFEFYQKVYDQDLSPSSEIFGERYTAAQVQWIFWSIISMFMNITGQTEVWACALSADKISCIPDVVNSFKGVSESLLPGLGQTENLGVMATIGQSPISGIGYTKNIISKFNIVKEVNAQGFGFNTGGNSVVALWKISRDFSFGLLVLATIILAFMIMFRVKISPQVVITVQSAIPKIITALILITFSYAIAGFMIDLMYVFIGLIAALITGAGLSNHSFTELFTSFTTGQNAIYLLFLFWGSFVMTAVATIFSSINPLTWVGGILLALFAIVTVLAMIVYTFKILALIFKNFAMIILTIVTGPFEILLGTITQNVGFGTWIRKLLSQLAVYPIIALMFYLAFFFLAQAVNLTVFQSEFATVFPFNPKVDVISGNSWDPPLSTFLVDGDALLWAIVAFVIVTMIPKTTEIIQAAMSGKPFNYGSAIGEVFGRDNWAWGATGGNVAESIKRGRSEKFWSDNSKRINALIDALNPLKKTTK